MSGHMQLLQALEERSNLLYGKDADVMSIAASVIRRQEADIEKLRRNFAAYLAPLYMDNPADIAELCDERLDRTGTLLGYVREALPQPPAEGEER